MKQPGECPSSDKWSPADHSATTYYNDHRHYDRNYCHHRHHQHHHHHQKQHRHYYQQQHHHCHSNYYHQYVTNVHRSKDKTLRDDDRYRSSFQFSVIFLNVLSYNHDNNDDANADADADDDGDNDADAKHDSDEVFLTENVSRFTVPGISFTSSYVW